MPPRTPSRSSEDSPGARIRRALSRLNPRRSDRRTGPSRRAASPDATPSRSAAVRHALANPSARQLSKWDREEWQRKLVLALAVVMAISIVAVLGFGYWRESIARGNEVVATVHGSTIALNDLLPKATTRVKSFQQTLAFLQAQGQEQQVAQFQFRMFRIPDDLLDEEVDLLLIRREAERRGITISDAEVDAAVRLQVDEFGSQNAPLPTETPTPIGWISPTPTVDATLNAAQTAEADSAATAAALFLENAGVAATADPAVPTATPTASPTVGETATPSSTPTTAPSPTPYPTLSADGFRLNYAAFLERTGFTDEQYRQIIRDGLLEDKVREAIGADVPQAQEQIHARQILAADPAAAQALLDKLAQGQSFEELAKAESIDPLSKDKGGDLDWLPRGMQTDAFDAAAFALQPGQRSGIVEIQGRGAAIIEVIEREAARPLTENQLQSLRAAAYTKWLTDAKADPAVSLPGLTSDQRDYVLRKAGVPSV